MPNKLRVVGIRRAQRFSPNSVERDAAICQAVADCLGRQGYDVSLHAEEAFTPSLAQGAAAVFSMARGTETVAALERLSTPVVNPVAGLRNARRGDMTRIFAEAGIPMPRSWMVRTDGTLPDVDCPCWLKRTDECAQASGDVVYVHGRDELATAVRCFAERGLHEAVVCEHLPGDLVKFYGVKGTGFFEYYYPTVGDGFSKFGLERHNGAARFYAFDAAALAATADRAASLLNLPVYGGDCIVGADGEASPGAATARLRR